MTTTQATGPGGSGDKPGADRTINERPANERPSGEVAGDPSMEDILASIRRILSEDDAKPGGTANSTPASAVPASPVLASAVSSGAVPRAPHPADEVLMLDPSMIVDEPATVAPQLAPAMAPQAAAAKPIAAAFEVEPPMPPAPPAAVASVPAGTEALVAPEAAAAAATSVGSLLRHLQAERNLAVHRGGPTIEDIVREEMRPLLKSWLDTHLPPLVERLVRAEIERVVTRSIS